MNAKTSPRTTTHYLSMTGGSALLLAGIAAFALPLQPLCAQVTTGFTQVKNSWDYNDPNNWVDGNINGIFDSSLSLSDNLTLTFDANTTLLTGLTFNYVGSRDVTFTANSTGPLTLTLGGDISVDMTSTRTVTFGSTTANRVLNVDLGGTTRNFFVNGTRSLAFVNEISNGGFVATGGGKVVLSNTSNTLTNITANGADIVINGSANTAANTTTTLTGALTVGPGIATGLGASSVTLTGASGRNTTFWANNLVRNQGTAVLFRGTNLGTGAFSANDVTNIGFTAAPTLSGTGTSGTTIGIIAEAYGDTSATGTGFGATGGLVTYDAANGVRLLTGSEYKTSITDGQTDLDNIRLTNTSGVGSTVTLNSNTAVNSLSLVASTTAGSSITLAGTGTLKLNTGVIYATTNTLNTAASALTIGNDLDLNGKEGFILFGTNPSGGSTGGANLQITGAITNDGGNGVTLSGAGAVEFGGTTANTYTGLTTLNGGALRLNKTTGVTSIAGDLLINGGRVLFGRSNQIADTSNITISGGVLDFRVASNSGSSSSDTFNNLVITSGTMLGGASGNSNSVSLNNATLSGGTISQARSNKLVVNGLFSFAPGSSDTGGTLTIDRANSSTGAYDSVTTLNGGLEITNAVSGAYTPIVIKTGTGGNNMGGKLAIASDVTFIGNTTNANTVLISGTTGSGGAAGVVSIDGERTFNIGDGAAASDLTIDASIINDLSAGSIRKTGLGTLELQGANTYTDYTTIDAGTVLINGSSASEVIVNSGGRLGGTGVINNSVTVNDGGTLAMGNGSGILNTYDLTLSGTGSILSLQIDGADAYGQVNVTGGVNLNDMGEIQLTLGSFAPSDDGLFFLILNDDTDAINGTLFGLAQGSIFSSGGYSWQVSYLGDSATNSFTGGNDLALMVVPEPKAWMLLGAGVMMLAFIRRRK